MGRRQRDKLEDWQVPWPSPGAGRYLKRRLSKARRRYIKSFLRFGRGKEQVGIEAECSWKGY